MVSRGDHTTLALPQSDQTPLHFSEPLKEEEPLFLLQLHAASHTQRWLYMYLHVYIPAWGPTLGRTNVVRLPFIKRNMFIQVR